MSAQAARQHEIDKVGALSAIGQHAPREAWRDLVAALGLDGAPIRVNSRYVL